jgi:hypothetical protein
MWTIIVQNEYKTLIMAAGMGLSSFIHGGFFHFCSNFFA